MNYIKVSKGIYKTGKSYRVRKTVNGERLSWNFSSKEKAKKFYNSLK